MAGYDLSGCGAGQCEIAVAGLPGWPPGRCDPRVPAYDASGLQSD